MMEVTFSKQWIHFRRSDRCPPTSTILKRRRSHEVKRSHALGEVWEQFGNMKASEHWSNWVFCISAILNEHLIRRVTIIRRLTWIWHYVGRRGIQWCLLWALSPWAHLAGWECRKGWWCDLVNLGNCRQTANISQFWGISKPVKNVSELHFTSNNKKYYICNIFRTKAAYFVCFQYFQAN